MARTWQQYTPPFPPTVATAVPSTTAGSSPSPSSHSMSVPSMAPDAAYAPVTETDTHATPRTWPDSTRGSDVRCQSHTRTARWTERGGECVAVSQ